METALPTAGPGSVVLDIGGGIGAAVVRTDPTNDGRELEIHRVGTPWSGQHVAFHRRRTAEGPVVAAVFHQLPAGDWEVRLIGTGGPSRPLSVRGGSVTTVRFSQD